MLVVNNLSVNLSNQCLLTIDHWVAEGGSFHSIVGPNGAGKSTLIKAISQDYRTEGTISLNDEPVAAISSRRRAQHIGVLSQASELSFPYKSWQVVEMGATPLNLSRSQLGDAMTHVMKACDCLHLKDRLYPRLSGGEKQRVQLARVLLQLSQAQQPPLLLLDEPTSAQDLGQQHGLLDLARRLCNEEGYTVIAILHDLNQALRYSDRCTLINNGAIAEHGETEQVLTPCIVEQYWGYRPERAVVESGQHGLV